MANPYPRNGLTKQQVSMKLTGGIDRKTDPKQLQNGQMYTCDNVQYTTEGQIRKRFGYSNLTPPGGLQGAPFAAVGCRDNVEPLILGSGFLNRYNPTTGLSTSIPANTQGRLSASQITASSGIGIAPSPPVNASAASDGQKYTLVTWEEIDTATGYLFYGIQDLSTGSWIISPTQITLPANASFTYNSKSYAITQQYCPRAFYSNGYFYIGVTFAGSNVTTSGNTTTTTYAAQIQAYAINLTNLSAGLLSTNLGYNIGTSAFSIVAASPVVGWDAVMTNGKFYVAFPNSSSPGSGYVNIATVNGTSFLGTTSGTYTGATPGNANFQRISIAVGPNAAYPVAITTGTSLITFTQALAQLTRTDYTQPTSDPYCYPTATIFNGNVAYGIAMCGVTGGTSALYVTVLGVNVATSSLVFSANYPTPSTSVAAGIVSRPWIYNGKMYLWTFSASYAGWGVYRSQVLMEINLTTAGLNYVARTSYQNAGLANQFYSVVPNDVINIPNTNKYVTYLTQTTDVVGGTPATLGTAANAATQAVVSNSFYGVLTRTQFDFTPATPSAMLNMPTGGVFVTGAIPLTYDGQALVEAGYSAAPDFTTAPELNGNGVTVTNASSGSGKIPAGTYTYYACFVRRDAYGNVQRSSPSSPYIVTVTGTNNIVQFPSIYYSRVPSTYIEYYRTTLIAPLQPQLLGKVPNGQGFVDTYTDASILSNPTLYTYSGEYPNDPPPAVHSAAFGETRAYLIPSDSRNTIWCSKKYSAGRSVEWTSNLILTEGGTHSGLFTAIAVLDTNIIVFKADQILYFYGDGPDNAGATGSFSAFQRLSSDVGCIDPGSLAIIPAGLVFRSARGIELLSRGLQVSYIGWPVEPLVQAITTIASATVMPQYQQIRFVPSVAGQPTLVYDYLGSRWSTYSAMSALSSANIQGVYWWISADGTTCNVETPGQFLDAGNNFIQLTIETPEIPSSALQGWGRIYRIGVLGEMKNSHALTVSFAYDHQEVYTDTVVYNAASAADNGGTGAMLWYDNLGQYPVFYITVPGPEQFRFSRVPRQVMQTLRLKLQDSPLTVYYWNDAFQPVTLPFGESCAISNITLETGQKAILAKLPGSQTV